MEDYVRQRHIEEGFEYVGTPHIAKEGLFHTSGPPALLRRDACSRRWSRRHATYRLKAMNCPMHNLIYRSRRPLLPRAAAAALRVRLGLPLREVRRRPRPDPRARDDPGRLALLRHPRAGAGRDQAPARLLPRPVPRLRARRLLPRAVDPRRLQARQVPSAPTRTGRSRPRCSQEVADRVRPRAGARPGRRGVLRPEDLGPGPRRDRPHLADVDHPVRLQPAAPTASTWSTSPPTAPASSR